MSYWSPTQVILVPNLVVRVGDSQLGIKTSQERTYSMENKAELRLLFTDFERARQWQIPGSLRYSRYFAITCEYSLRPGLGRGKLYSMRLNLNIESDTFLPLSLNVKYDYEYCYIKFLKHVLHSGRGVQHRKF